MSSEQIAWIAGSTGGIGGACRSLLDSRGWTTFGSDRPDVDLSVAGSAEAWLPGVLAGRSLNGAVHAVGMSGRRLGDGPLSACTEEGWESILRVNLTSAFRFLKLALSNASEGSSVVVIGSALAKTLDEDFLTAAYRVSKAALIPLVEAAAFEAAPRNVRVNVVSPGLVSTPMAARALGDERIQARFPELMPLGASPATAEEVAAAVGWLLGPDSTRTTGAVIPVDCGWSL